MSQNEPGRLLKAWRAAQARWNKANDYNEEMVKAGEELYFAGDAIASALSETDTYQGWTNRETWLVHLWLTNEEDLYHRALDAAKAVDTYAPENVENVARNALDEREAGAASGWTLDLINAALARVDWAEIANALREG